MITWIFFAANTRVGFQTTLRVLAGIFSSHSLTENGMGPRQLGVGFWRQSEVSPQAWAEEKIVEIAGFKVLLALPQIDLLLLHGGEIDYSAKEGLFLRTSEY